MSSTPLLEPTGHIADRSKFERIWEKIPAGCAFRRTRVERFDAENLVAYSPLEYSIEEITPISVEIDDAIIAKDIIDFVRDEFGTKPQSDRFAREPAIVEEERFSPQLFADYLAEVEETFVYGPYLAGLRPPRPLDGDTGQFVHRVLCDPRLGNAANCHNVDQRDFAKRVNASLLSQERLCFVLPAFPFKDQNPLRCPAPTDHVDIAEIGLLSQMHFLALAFFQGHPFGSDFIVLSDGNLYSSIFGVEKIEVERYIAKLRQWRNLLNLQGSVHVVDLEECIERLPAIELEQFLWLKRRVSALLLDEQRIAQSADLQRALINLTNGMKRNLNSKGILAGASWDEKRSVFGGTPITEKARRMSRDLDERARYAAASYAAMNVALRRHRVVDRMFQNAIRATIHPKPNQIALPRSGTVYPWNGVGVFDPGATFPERIKTRPFGELGDIGSQWISGYLPGEVHPSYYRRAP
jgi:pyoverdine/dityrosine biosynthesis protein Dit1